jgi:hypothetical protein
MTRLTFVPILPLGKPVIAQTTEKHGADCSAGWPTSKAQGALKNAELLKDEDIVIGETSTIRSGDDGEQQESQVLLHY